jgi:DNA invertase Pin-like site-specific DNA recombinase
LGLEAQKAAVSQYLNGGSWELVAEFTEVETGKGSNALDKRPQLKAALDRCKKDGARVLIAKLDRLSRNLHFITGLMESKVEFVAVDFPEANELTIHIMAAMAQHEAKMISQRTKAALAAAKARGVSLGKAGASNLRPNIEKRQEQAREFAEKLRGTVEGFRLRGISQRAMTEELNILGIQTARGGQWSLMQVQRLLATLDSSKSLPIVN